LIASADASKYAAVKGGAARIVFVTGKGGTGKSFLARALARAASARAMAVALVHARPPALAGIASGGHASSNGRSLPFRQIELDEREALESFLTRILRLGFVARRLLDSRTFSAVAAAAPGVSDLVRLLGITALSRPEHGLDLIVVDAPATGHSLPLLTAPRRILELAPMGPVAREARIAQAIVENPARFVPVIMTTPEELAVTETLALHEDIARAGVAAARVVVNGMWPAHLQAPEADWLLSSAASADAALHWKRHRRQVELIDMLEARVGACPRLPFAFHEGETSPAAVAAVLDLLVPDGGARRP